jgi:hypothetical protein
MSTKPALIPTAEGRVCRICHEVYPQAPGSNWRDAWQRHERQSSRHQEQMRSGYSPPLPWVWCPECPRAIVTWWHRHQLDERNKTWNLICQCGHKLLPISNMEIQGDMKALPWQRLKED